MPRPRVLSPRMNVASIRLNNQERIEMEQMANRLGCGSVSEYVRHLHQLGQKLYPSRTDAACKLQLEFPWESMRIFFQTRMGTMLHGNSLAYLFNGTGENSVDLIMTSPPFGLVRKKGYGNEDAHRYCDWFRPFAEGFRRVLKDSGSLVIDIGGAWKPNLPTRSLYHFELLIMLCEEFGFHLAQEHYWWNPAKLPSPAEWVNIRRVRVKDAVNTIWWLSKTPFPKANNRRVLAPYSKSMKKLMRDGYQAKLRPSGHDISNKFGRDNGGSVPPNLLAIANTESTGRYQAFCRAHGLPIHPARFPTQLPEYFIRFLTDPGDLVIDPFAGSCVTGAVAEHLKRRWICCETSEEYLSGALSRFKSGGQLAAKTQKPYQIFPPCQQPIDEGQTPLVLDGGKSRHGSFPKRKSQKLLQPRKYFLAAE
jgi:DNA modification methylase